MHIFEAIPKIMAEMDSIPKTKKPGSTVGYAFRGIDDLYNHAQKLMSKHGVFTMPEVLEASRHERQSKSGGVLNYTILRIKYTFWGKDGSWVAAVTEGEAMDSGDKSTSKAMSIAHKYCLLQALMVATADIVDPDTEAYELESEVKKAPAPKQKSPPPVPKESTRPNILDISKYIIPGGKFKQQALGDVADLEELHKELQRATDHLSQYPKAKGSAELSEFIDTATRFLLYTEGKKKEIPNLAPQPKPEAKP